MPLYSQVTYTGNGSTVAYAIPFSYIDSTHIKAYLNGTITTAFTISTSTLTFTTAPANGVTIRIERQTPIDARLVDFSDGSVLTEADLDRSANQNFYVAQEITDDQANNLALDTDDKYNAQSKVIKNVANPVNANDAVNKTYLENTWLSTSDKATLTNLNSNILLGTINASNAIASNYTNTISNILQTNINQISASASTNIYNDASQYNNFKLENNQSNLIYPPVGISTSAISSFTSALVQSQFGNYQASASSNTASAYLAFDRNLTTEFTIASAYSNTSGNYSNSGIYRTSNIVSGTLFIGEWLQLYYDKGSK